MKPIYQLLCEDSTPFDDLVFITRRGAVKRQLVVEMLYHVRTKIQILYPKDL